MNKKHRLEKLINMLMEEVRFKPVANYADKLNVSSRTIHSDLEEIKPCLQKMGLAINKRRGIGIKAISIKKEIETNESGETSHTVINNMTNRRRRILEILLFETTITVQALSELLIVSKSSIYKDLMFIKHNFLNAETVSLISSNSGTWLEGTEEEIQNTFVRFNKLFIEPKLDLVNYYEGIRQANNFLEEYYGKEIVKLCYRLITKDSNDNKDEIADYYIQNALNILIVLISRSSQGFHINETVNFGDRSSDELLDEIGRELGISFTYGDKAYFNKHMIANKLISNELNLNTQQKNINIIDDIIEKMGETLKVDFARDNELRESLITHFDPMIYRLKNGITFYNPFLTQIKNDFGLMFNVTWFVLGEFEEDLDINFTEDEIGFIMIYFQSTLDKQQLSKKVLVVCPTGITMSGILLNRVKKVLPPLDSIEVASFNELSETDLGEIDFIISTAHVKINHPLVVVVSPLLNEKEMQKISDAYNSYFFTKQQTPKEQELVRDLKIIKKFFNSDFLEFNSDYQSAEDMINSVILQLYEGGYTYKGYKNSLLERTKRGDIDLPTGVALPHGHPKYVKKTIVGICVNKNPIKWGEQYIQVAIFLCIANSDLKQVKNILGAIYNLIEYRENIERIFVNKSKDEFSALIGGI